MPNLTENYNLKKPLLEEFYDVNVQNENMDIIDQELFDRARAPFIATITGNYKDGYQLDKTFADIMTAYAESREMLIFDPASSVRLFRFVKASGSYVCFAYNNGEDAIAIIVYKDGTVEVTSLSFLSANHANDVTAHDDIRQIALNALNNAGNAQTTANTALEKANSHTHDVDDVNGILPISKGGTGATTASAARTNLGITPTNIGAAPSSHNQAASTITAGTFAGQVVANSGGQAAGTSLLRNSKLVSADTNPTVNGEICWTYK